MNVRVRAQGSLRNRTQYKLYFCLISLLRNNVSTVAAGPIAQLRNEPPTFCLNKKGVKQCLNAILHSLSF